MTSTKQTHSRDSKQQTLPTLSRTFSLLEHSHSHNLLDIIIAGIFRMFAIPLQHCPISYFLEVSRFEQKGCNESCINKKRDQISIFK
jgi:hypothetical protein